MGNDWNSNELIFDESPQRGVHRIGGDNIRFLEEGVEIEADCPNCQDTTTVEIDWGEVVDMAQSKPVENMRRVRGGYVALATCQSCLDRLLSAQVSEQQARKGATAQIDIEMSEVGGWVNRGRSAGKITRRQFAEMKNAQQRRRAPAAQPKPAQAPAPRRRRGLVPRARRR